jgi:NAD(P)-dependent dehydrogenase (short-subunit alcohol dehydrogenase family)
MAIDRGLSDKVALVTGGGSGIGHATALRLAAEGTGVFVVGRRRDRLENTVAEVAQGGGRADYLSIDLTERDGADRAVSAALAWGGRLDILVNAAGSFPYTPFAEMTDDDWNEALNLNLSAVMRTCRAAAKPMGEMGGAIVNVSSTNAVMGDKLSACGAYSAAKAGQLGLTRQIAVELAPKIRVNAVMPGAVKTEMLEGWNEDSVDMAAWIERYTPLARIGRPEDIAAVIAFLVSDEAAYVTGAVLPVDGGMSVV